jgi:hypothetical protein
MARGNLVARHRTQFVFAGCVVFSLFALALLFLTGTPGVILVVASIIASVAAIIISERSGFARTSQLRRAFEPSRHFNSAQVGVLVLLAMAQLTALLYVLISG